MKRFWIAGVLASAMSLGGFALKTTQAAVPVGGMTVAEKEKKVAALTAQMKDIDDQMDTLRETHTKALMAFNKSPEEARAFAVKQHEEMDVLKAKRLALWKERDALDGPEHMTVPEIKARIAAVDLNMATTREKYDKMRDSVVKGSEEAKDLEAHHREKIEIMKARKLQLETELADAEKLAVNRNAFAAGDIKAKIADVDTQIVAENKRYADKTAQVNQVKHDIWVQMNAKPAPTGDAKNALIHRMQVQDGILGEEWKQHLATMEELGARKSHLEGILANIKP